MDVMVRIFSEKQPMNITKFGLRFLTVLAAVLLAMMLVLPAAAQDTSGSSGGGYVSWQITVDANGISIYGVDADGGLHLVFNVPVGDANITVSGTDGTNVQATGGYLLVNTSYLNVRSGDGPGYTVLGVVAGGDRLEVVGRNAKHTWWFVNVDGTEGWVNDAHVLVRGNLSDTPVVESHGTLIQPTLYVGYPGNYLWSDLSANGVIVCVLPGNAEHLLLGRSPGGNFYLIETECNGETVQGWISKDLGIVRNPASVTIPVVTSP